MENQCWKDGGTLFWADKLLCSIVSDTHCWLVNHHSRRRAWKTHTQRSRRTSITFRCRECRHRQRNWSSGCCSQIQHSGRPWNKFCMMNSLLRVSPNFCALLYKAGNTRETMLRNRSVAQQKLRNRSCATIAFTRDELFRNKNCQILPILPTTGCFGYEYAGTSKSAGDILHKVQGFRARSAEEYPESDLSQ